MKNNCIFPNKKLVRRVALFYIVYKSLQKKKKKIIDNWMLCSAFIMLQYFTSCSL